MARPASLPAAARPVGLVAAAKDRALIGLMPHPAQEEFLRLVEGNRILFAACGRRFGKSRAAAAAALHNLFFVPEADLLVTPGETRYALIVATSREQALLVLEHARTLVRSSRALSHELVEEGEYQLTFRGNRALLAIPCNARSIRGYAASCVVFDECAHMNDADVDGPMVASRLWAALTPSVAQFGEFGRIIAISTPSGSAGFFAEMFQKCRGGEIPGAAAYSAPTSANPLIDGEYLQAQEAALGADDFDREFRAVFTAGGAAYIDAERLRECVADWHEVRPTDGRDWIASFDPAFSRDAAALAIVGRSHDDPSRFLIGYTQRWLPTRPRRLARRSREEDTARIEQVVADVAGVCKTYGLHNVITDQHLSGVMESEFGKHGLRTITRAWTTSSRAAGFRSLRALIHTGRVEFPDDPVLIAEAGRLREKPGRQEIVTPRVGDSHCDLVLAVTAGVLEHERHGVVRPMRTSSAMRRMPLRRAEAGVSVPAHNDQMSGAAVTYEGWEHVSELEREHLGRNWGRR